MFGKLQRGQNEQSRVIKERAMRLESPQGSAEAVSKGDHEFSDFLLNGITSSWEALGLGQL